MKPLTPDLDKMQARLDDEGSFELSDARALLAELRTLRARVAELEAPGECNSIHKLNARVMELEAELLNERGEGTPPSEGWAYVDTTWRRDGWRIYRYDSGEDVRWLILLNGWPKGKETTARAAMRAAAAALTGSQS